MSVSCQTRDQVAAFLESLIDEARHGNRAALARLVAPELTGCWRGRPVHGIDELGAVLIEPFELDSPAIFCEGTIAWITARLVWETDPGRVGGFTAVLRGTGHAWLLAQIHASLPA